MGRQPPCGERRIGILPKDRQSHFWIDYVQGFYKVMELHPRQISRRADPSLRFGRRPRGVRRHEVFQRGVDQRQHRSAFARPHPVRHQPVLSGDGHGFARLGHAQPPDQQHHADQIPLRHGLRGPSGHGVAAQADERRGEGLRSAKPSRATRDTATSSWRATSTASARLTTIRATTG